MSVMACCRSYIVKISSILYGWHIAFVKVTVDHNTFLIGSLMPISYSNNITYEEIFLRNQY
jgi:hypothetical protein